MILKNERSLLKDIFQVGISLDETMNESDVADLKWVFNVENKTSV